MLPGSSLLNTLPFPYLLSMERRFLQFVGPPDERGCMRWQGAVDKRGYGVISVALRVQRAHRVVWRLVHGSVPEDRLVCHTCDVRDCVAPYHLFLGTHLENMRDAERKGRGRGSQNAAKTHCPKGHPYSPENTWAGLRKTGYYSRACKACNRLHKKKK